MSKLCQTLTIGSSTEDDERNYSTAGFIARPDDPSVPNKIYDGRILEVQYTKEEAGITFFDSSFSISGSTIVLDNSDNYLKNLPAKSGVNRFCTILSGNVGDFLSQFIPDFFGIFEDAWKEKNLVKIKVSSYLSKLDKVLNTPWTSGARVNQYKPFVLGRCFNVPVINIGPSDYLYSDEECTLLRVRDQGDELTEGVHYTDNADGTFTMLVSVVGRLTCDVVSLPMSGLPTDEFPAFFDAICARAGVSITAASSGLPAYSFGYYAAEPTSALTILEQVARSVAGAFWSNVDGEFCIERLPYPDTATPVLDITQSDMIFEADYKERPDLLTGFSDVVAALKNWHVNSESELATSLIGTTLGQQLSSDFRVRKRATPPSGSGSAVDAFSDKEGQKIGSKLGGIGTLIADESDAQAEADHWTLLYNKKRRFFEISVRPDQAFKALQLMQVVRLDSDVLNASNLKVVVIAISRQIDQVALTLWG